MEYRKKPFFPLAVIIVLALVLGGYAALRVTGGPGARAPGAAYRVRRETIRNIIAVAGTISPAREQNLQAADSGRVTAVYVKEGDQVKKGQVILQLDDTEQRYNLARHDYDMLRKRVDGPRGELELMAKEREMIARRLDDRRVVAGFDGVIAAFTALPGDYLQAKDSVGVIINREYLKATVEVAETDAPRLRKGQRVALTFPANGNNPVEGSLYSFSAMGSKTSRGASVVLAEIRVPDPPGVILPNFSFSGEIELEPPVESLLLVERYAIGRDDGGTYAERILPGGAARRVAVEVEPYSGEFVRILDGLSEGDTLAEVEPPPRSGGGLFFGGDEEETAGVYYE